MIRIREGIAKLLKEEFQIEPNVTQLLFERGILNEKDCKKVLIKKEYEAKVEAKKKEILKDQIAEKYCISVSLVKKIIQND